VVLGLGACAGGGDPPGVTLDPVTGEPIDGNAGGDGDGDGDGNNNGGDGDGDGDAEPLPDGTCAAIRRDAPEGRGGVDVIFLLDTSGSMLHAITQVTANLATFIQEFENTNADTRVVMITGGDPAAGSPVANDANRYRFIQSEVDSGALYTVALATFPAYQDFLRPNAATQFVMITDDNDAMPPALFQQEMEKALGHSLTQHAIASENVNGLPCISEAQVANPLCAFPIPAICAAAAIGETYYSLADQTNGETMSICKNDWTEVFAQLKAAVIDAVPLPCDYSLAEAAGEQAEDLDPEKVSIVYKRDDAESQFPRASTPDACADKLGWFYDNPESPSSISLCPAACEAVQEGGSIDLAFGCAPPLVL
jgi:hypothetical protein